MFTDIAMASNPTEAHECVVMTDVVWYLVEFMDDGSVNCFEV